MIVPQILQQYLDNHISTSDPLLEEVERRTFANELQPHMISGMHQGLFLQLLVSIKAPLIALEIGTFTGFAALAMAGGLGPEGKLITIEKDAEMALKAKINIDNSPLSEKIVMHTGDAYILLPEILNRYQVDFAFIDADKSRNLDYYNIILEKMPSGGIILIDNVLWKGKVYEPAVQDNTTHKFRALNDFIASDQRVTACIIPIRDGIWMIRKK